MACQTLGPSFSIFCSISLIPAIAYTAAEVVAYKPELALAVTIRLKGDSFTKFFSFIQIGFVLHVDWLEPEALSY